MWENSFNDKGLVCASINNDVIRLCERSNNKNKTATFKI